MKYFRRGEKHNWIDENNVFLGFDTSYHISEFDFYYITVKPEKYDRENKGKFNPNLDSYRFSKTEFYPIDDNDQLDKGGAICFKLESETELPLYLVLFNHHNGFYGSGFELKKGKTIFAQGSL